MEQKYIPCALGQLMSMLYTPKEIEEMNELEEEEE